MPGLKSAARARALAPSWSVDLGEHIIGLAWQPRGEVLGAALVGGEVALLEAKSGRRVRVVQAHAQGSFAVRWHPKGTEFATVGQDGKARIWPLDGEAPRLVLEGGAPWVEQLAYSADGSLLATGAGRKLRLWDSQSGELLQDFADHPATIADIAWHPLRNELATGSYGGVWMWNAAQATPMKHFDWKGSVLKLAWSPDGKHIATGNQDATVHFWILATGKDLHMWGYRSKIRELAWDPKSRYLATGGSATVIVWDCSGKGPAGTKPQMLDFHANLLSALAFQSKGGYLASGCLEGLVAVWQPAKNDQPLATEHCGTAIAQLVWSPDEKSLAIGTDAGKVAVLVP